MTRHCIWIFESVPFLFPDSKQNRSGRFFPPQVGWQVFRAEASQECQGAFPVRFELKLALVEHVPLLVGQVIVISATAGTEPVPEIPGFLEERGDLQARACPTLTQGS